MKNRAFALFTLLAATLLLPAALRAQSIGVNIGPVSPYSLAATTSAGVPAVAQTNYNNVFSSSNVVLNDNMGAATTARVSFVAGFLGTSFVGSSFSGGDEALNNFYIRDTTVSYSVTNIPYLSYSVFVYELAPNGAVQSVSLGGPITFFTLSPNPTGTGYIDNNAATAFTYTQGTGLTQATATANADYVVFAAQTASSFTLTLTGVNGGNAYLEGFQIVAVPEPSTWALLGTGVAGLGVVTYRRRIARA